jgi:two-component system NarL family sensor kinase
VDTAFRDSRLALPVVNAVAETLAGADDTRQALEQTLGLIAERLGLHTGWVWLLDTETGRYYNAAAHGLPPYLQEPVHMTGELCWCLEAFAAGRLDPRNIGILQCSRLREASKRGCAEAARGLRAHASIPLYFRDRPLGVLNVAAPEGRDLTPEELGLLSAIASQVGVALERVRLAAEQARLVRAEERTRLAREIHDTLAQGLTGIGLHLEGALNRLETDPTRARERLERALTLTREALEEARRSVLHLRAAPLDGRPLSDALSALLRDFTADTGIRVRTRMGADFPPLPPRMEGELYRIVQEALANVRTHAVGATEVTLSLESTADNVRLTIADNGPGLPTRHPTLRDGGQGIPGMRERTRVLGGTLRIQGRVGKGVRVTATVPLPPSGETP